MKSKWLRTKVLWLILVVLLAAAALYAQGNAEPWSPDKAYNGGAWVTHVGHFWTAKWWTQGEEPGVAAVWEDRGPISPATPTATPTPTVTPTPTSTPTSTPMLINIAPGKPVVVSGVFSPDFPKTALNDENDATVWGSAYNKGPQWFFFDLGTPTAVESVVIKFFNPYFSPVYHIGVSDDAATWVFAASITDGNGGDDTVPVGRTTRYVGVYLTQGAKRAYGVKEFEIYAVQQTPTPTSTPTPPITAVPSVDPLQELDITYTTTQEDATSFTGSVLMKNANATYHWNGTYFAVKAIKFETTSTITKCVIAGVQQTVTVEGNEVTVALGSSFANYPYNTQHEMTITGTKAGSIVYPTNFTTDYYWGEEIVYPDYDTLPASWRKQKPDLLVNDLISDPASYYQTTIQPIQDTYILYDLPHPTQLILSQRMALNYPLNTVEGVRIKILGRYMALGLGAVQEWFKINPNYMVALGSKENYAAGLVNATVGVGTPVEIDGETWYWPMTAHNDGPYQQESGNFLDCKTFFPDFLLTVNHGDVVPITINPEDTNWISAGFSSGLSLMVTREQMNSLDTDYNAFIRDAKDPCAELVVNTYAYNRGIYGFFGMKLFTANRQTALNSTDIVTDFNMGGFASHVPTVREVTKELNNDLSDIYDEYLSWDDMLVFFANIRKFYANGTPTDAEWNIMIDDVQKAFDVLKAHWDNQHVSVRYDLMTLIRVMRRHMPQSYIPRPTGQEWQWFASQVQP